jgi:hypothetical protein
VTPSTTPGTASGCLAIKSPRQLLVLSSQSLSKSTQYASRLSLSKDNKPGDGSPRIKAVQPPRPLQQLPRTSHEKRAKSICVSLSRVQQLQRLGGISGTFSLHTVLELLTTSFRSIWIICTFPHKSKSKVPCSQSSSSQHDEDFMQWGAHFVET